MVVTYFVSETETPYDLEKCASEPHTIMSGVHPCETQQRAVSLKHSRWHLFYPMACNREIRVLISGLPCITCETYKAGVVTLEYWLTKNETIQWWVVLTVIFNLKLWRFFLNSSMMCLRVTLRPGILTPFVARAATSIIFLNDGWSKAWIGCIFMLDLADQRGDQ